MRMHNNKSNECDAYTRSAFTYSMQCMCVCVWRYRKSKANGWTGGLSERRIPSYHGGLTPHTHIYHIYAPLVCVCVWHEVVYGASVCVWWWWWLPLTALGILHAMHIRVAQHQLEILLVFLAFTAEIEMFFRRKYTENVNVNNIPFGDEQKNLRTTLIVFVVD